MKKLDLSNVQAGVRKLGAIKATYEHLQEAASESLSELINALIAGETEPVLLYGCVNGDTPPDYDITVGAIFYQGEVFAIPAFAGTATGADVPVLSIVTTYRAGDPVLYSDNNTYNTHAIRTMQWSFGATGSGIADFADLPTIVDTLTAILNIPAQLSALSLLTGTLEVQGGIRTINSGAFFKMKTLQIGAWNMSGGTGVFFVNVPHGLGSDYLKIRRISAFILHDNGTDWYDFYSDGGISNVIIDNTNVRLARLNSGIFDNANFDHPSMNRGYCTIEYEA